MTKLTPMMAQYKEIKAEYNDCILMFRLGDFYEMFFEDAVEASKILQITLTARGKSETRTPMCGVPYHAVDQYLFKLTRSGKKVAICDQVTEPDGKSIVQREVVRVVTPGTTFDDNILDRKANNYVAALVGGGQEFAFAYCDVTTGDFRVTELKSREDLRAELNKAAPAELICDEALFEDEGVKKIFNNLSELHVFAYDYLKDPETELKLHFELKSLDVFGLTSQKLIHASGMLIEYLRETQKTDLDHIQGITSYQVSDFMTLDENCIRNLELFFTNKDSKKEGSLIWAIDETTTAMGGRLLRQWLITPLLNKAQIDQRLEHVTTFVSDSSLLRAVREELHGIYDIERLLSRLSLGSGNARDLLAMKDSLKKIPSVKKLLPEAMKNINEALKDFSQLVNLIERAIKDEVPATLREGGMIADGFDKELDELRSVSSEGKTFIKELQEREIKRTGVSSLKVKYNKVFGYYIEISKANLSSVPEDYIRKQTLVNAERFITPELKEYEEKVLTAEDRIKELEYELFYKVRMEVVKSLREIQQSARALAKVDIFSGFAFLAEKSGYCRPKVLESGDFMIEQGRHAVIEQLSGDFVPNDCNFSNERRVQLITGPNMGGKSTFLRQVALISLLAQVGSFVPAKSASLSIVDRIFTRVGASDNLAKGDSTFMVEMQEAATILHHATDRSLVVLDEIGRGTSTYDGVSIAWAMMEYLHNKIGAKVLFATHYHELIELADSLEKACNMSVAVRENEKEGVVFLYKVIEGGTDKSYGIEVAKLAGLPVDVIGRARGVLQQLEHKHIKGKPTDENQIDMFDKRDRGGLNSGQKEVIEALKSSDVNELSPVEAWKKLSDIKKLF